MEITLTTPALLFPTISLLLVAYTKPFQHDRREDSNPAFSIYKDNPENVL